MVAFYPTECFYSHDGLSKKKKYQMKYSVGVGITLKAGPDPNKYS